MGRRLNSRVTAGLGSSHVDGGGAEEAWLGEWQRRVHCWARALPAQGRTLYHCAGALGLHLSSRLEGVYRAALRGGGGGGALPPQGGATPGAGSTGGGGSIDGCAWLETEALTLPDFPPLPNEPSAFRLPAIPQLLPRGAWRGAWDELLLRGELPTLPAEHATREEGGVIAGGPVGGAIAGGLGAVAGGAFALGLLVLLLGPSGGGKRRAPCRIDVRASRVVSE